jgi:DNA double-strand break repair helicase HerA and related ATPase
MGGDDERLSAAGGVPQVSDFDQQIAAAYAAGEDSIDLGRGLLEGQLHQAAAVRVPLSMVNRHGLIAGATGTGKTKTLQVFAEQLFSHGVPVLVADVKGDLSGLAKIVGANETQEQSLGLVFHYADEKGVPLLDLSDLRALRTGDDGRGVISCVELPAVQDKPALFSTALMGILAELFETLPEAGDLPKPKLAFFFDEAHLLFDGATDGFLNSVQQTVRLIRSKGVGVYFVTQSPRDVPSAVLGQLGNRVQHALRAFRPREISRPALRRGTRKRPERWRRVRRNSASSSPRARASSSSARWCAACSGC